MSRKSKKRHYLKITSVGGAERVSRTILLAKGGPKGFSIPHWKLIKRWTGTFHTANLLSRSSPFLRPSRVSSNPPPTPIFLLFYQLFSEVFHLLLERSSFDEFPVGSNRYAKPGGLRYSFHPCAVQFRNLHRLIIVRQCYYAPGASWPFQATHVISQNLFLKFCIFYVLVHVTWNTVHVIVVARFLLRFLL